MRHHPTPFSIVLIAALLFPLACPDLSWAFLDFSKDTWKTTGIVMGITAGVLLLVVLIAGTVTDIKGRKGGEEDIWADLLDNRTLAFFPGLLAGPVLLEDMKQVLAAPPPYASPDLAALRHASWNPPSGVKQLNPALFHTSVGSCTRPTEPIGPAGRGPDAARTDAARFVLLLKDGTNSGCTR